MTVDEIEVDNADVIRELEGILRSQGVIAPSEEKVEKDSLPGRMPSRGRRSRSRAQSRNISPSDDLGVGPQLADICLDHFARPRGLSHERY